VKLNLSEVTRSAPKASQVFKREREIFQNGDGVRVVSGPDEDEG
jgi:hypothetical protein